MKQIAKLFLPLFVSVFSVEASEQLILIISNDFNVSHAILTRYEKVDQQYQQVGQSVPVNIGRNGLGWGLGEAGLTHGVDEPLKKEGDGKAPAGIFKISKAFGYTKTLETKMPYVEADKELICVDDVNSQHYNQILSLQNAAQPKSFEWMRRQDDLYKMGLIVEHNSAAVKGAGSCIFFHIRKSEDAPTAGCSAMREDDLFKIIKWLDPKKEPKVVQIPKKYCVQTQTLFQGITCPQ